MEESPAVRGWMRREVEKHEQGKILLHNIKTNLPALKELLEFVSDHWRYEDRIYRFYHHSFKVYYLQEETIKILGLLEHIRPPKGQFCDRFLQITSDGTGKVWEQEHNKEWDKHCRPILEAFFHAKFFLEMVVKYGEELEEAPQLLPSGWAALLHLYCIR